MRYIYIIAIEIERDTEREREKNDVRLKRPDPYLYKISNQKISTALARKTCKSIPYFINNINIILNNNKISSVYDYNKRFM